MNVVQGAHRRARALEWCPSQQLLVVAGDGGALDSAGLTVSLWRFAALDLLEAVAQLGKPPWAAWPQLRSQPSLSCAFSPNGTRLLLGCRGQAPLAVVLQVGWSCSWLCSAA